MAAITVDTVWYEAAHNKKPKGHGRWGFSIWNGQTTIRWEYGNYTQAKKSAIEFAKSINGTKVSVLP